MKLKGTSVRRAGDKPRYPKGINFVAKTLRTTGERVRYGYYGRGPGAIALGLEGTPEFFDRLAEALRKEPTAGTVNQLIAAYKAKELPRKAERTQADYRARLDKISDEFGALSLRAMGSDAIVPHIVRWRDAAASSPRQADYLIQVLSALLSWGARPEQRLISKNQVLGIERLYDGDRRENVWSDQQIAALFAAAREPVRRALVLALETGQRQGDLLRLSWNAVKASHIELRQQKTGVEVAIPISPMLKACLDASPRGKATTVLTTSKGLPWDPKGNSFRAAWADACADAGIEGVTFHDLRGTFATRRMAEGWSTDDVAFCTGHSLRDLASLERYLDRKTVARARAQRLAQRMEGGAS